MYLNLIKDGRLSYESTNKVLKSNYKTSFSYKNFPYKKPVLTLFLSF